MTGGSKQGGVFEKPVIHDFGSLVEITAMMSDGDKTDAAFPQGTPKGDLTFS